MPDAGCRWPITSKRSRKECVLTFDNDDMRGADLRPRPDRPCSGLVVCRSSTDLSLGVA